MEDFMAENKNEALINELFQSIESKDGQISSKDFGKKLDNLIKSGVKISEINSIGGISLMQSLVLSGRTDLIGEALNRGASLNDKKNPLFVHVRDVDTAKYLLKKGANINAMNSFGMSALANAAANGDKELCDFLIKNGAKLDQKNEMGQTLMHQAVMGGNIDIVRDLQKRGLNINARDKDGYTPLDTLMNSEYGDPETIAALKKLGAKPNIGYEHLSNCCATLGNVSVKFNNNEINLGSIDKGKAMG